MPYDNRRPSRCAARTATASGGDPLFVLLILALFASGVGAPGAHAEGDTVELHLPAQSLGSALEAYSHTTGVQLIYRPEAVAGLKSPALDGHFTKADALAQLVKGTGLKVQNVDDHTVAIKKPERVAANDAADTKKAEKAEPTELPEMTVTASPLDNTSYNVPNATTATKTDTPIMEMPVSIQVIPQQVLRDQQVIRIGKALENVSGVINRTPSTGFGGRFGTERVEIRGFGQSVTYRDGVRFPTALDGGIFGSRGLREAANLERIEVLKGPGAILYGRMEPGGVVNLVTKQPQSAPYYALGQQFGSFDLYRTTLDATGPLTGNEDLTYRFNLAYENAGNFAEFVGREQVFVAPVLRWDLSPQTQVTLDLEYRHTLESGVFHGVPMQIDGQPAPVPRDRNFAEPTDFGQTDEVLVSLKWSHAFTENWTLRHSFTADFVDNDFRTTVFTLDPAIAASDFGIDPAPGDIPNRTLYRAGFNTVARDEIYATTLDLVGKFDTWELHHTLLLGGDYLRQPGEGGFRGAFVLPPTDIFAPTHGDQPVSFFEDSGIDQTEDWYGFYVQDQAQLPYGFHVLAGFRYDRAAVERTFSFDFPTIDVAEEHVTPRFGLLWRPRPELSLYGSYTENFGGASLGRITRAGSPLPAETAEQWEAGVKTELFDGRLTGTLAYFQLTKQNIAKTDPTDFPLFRFSIPLGEVQTRGVELDVSGEILPGLRAIASYAHIDSEVLKDVDADGGPGNTGGFFSTTPRDSGSLWFTREWVGGPLAGLLLGGGAIFRGEQVNLLGPLGNLPGVATVNLMVGYQHKIGPTKLSFQFNVDNVLDKTYFESVNDAGLAGPVAFIPNAGRTFLGQISVEF